VTDSGRDGLTSSATDTVPTLPEDVAVVNVGLPMFADAVAAQGRAVVSVDWRIPAGGDLDLVAALARLYGRRSRSVDAANAEVLRRLDEGVPHLVEVAPAGAVVPGLEERMLLHCGPPLDYTAACDPLRRSMRAAVVAEGWASTREDADRMLARGEIALDAANAHDLVVPMVTALGPSQPVWVAALDGWGKAFAPLNQGPGETPWFGRETDVAIDRLRFLADAVGPVLAGALQAHGPIDALGLAGQGVQMGDDAHIRVQATTNVMLRNLLPHLVASDHPSRAEVAGFLSSNHLFFLTAGMAAARALTGWAGEVPGSSIVTTMARNGGELGIKLAGTDDWHLTSAPSIGQALYYAGQGPETSARDVGDSAVLELVGLGGPAAAGSPSVAAFVGGSMSDALAMTTQLDLICAGRSSRFKLPTLDWRGTPLGVDVRKVVELGITPKVTTGILHVSDGSGQVGAGVATAPIECFQAALLALDREVARAGG
jgi:hypothetical protein